VDLPFGSTLKIGQNLKKSRYFLLQTVFLPAKTGKTRQISLHPVIF
jgi:hypothetical protein